MCLCVHFIYLFILIIFSCLKKKEKKKVLLTSSKCQGLAEEEKLIVNQEVSAGTDAHVVTGGHRGLNALVFNSQGCNHEGFKKDPVLVVFMIAE